MFAVIDLETTGFSPATDRIVELALIHVDHHGRFERQWSTLVNPRRPMTAGHVHRINDAMVANAPTIEQLLPWLAQQLSGRILVAHNATFDAAFLRQALLGSGYSWDTPAPLCTRRVASALGLEAANDKLGTMCAQFGIEPDGAPHQALTDARMCGRLLSHMITAHPNHPVWRQMAEVNRHVRWFAGPPQQFTPLPRPHQPPVPVPTAAPLAVPPAGGQLAVSPTSPEPHIEPTPAATTPAAHGWLAKAAQFLPSHGEPADTYLSALDVVLADGDVTAAERDSLAQLADRLGLTATKVTNIHKNYLAAVARMVVEDDVVTAEEQGVLDRATELLGLTLTQCAAAVKAAREGRERHLRLIHGFHRGDTVCFTGADMDNGKEVWAEYAHRAGFTVHPSVTKQTTVVVYAAGFENSGKATKGRVYDIPVIPLAQFAELTRTATP